MFFICMKIAFLLQIKIFSANYGFGILLDALSHKIMIQSAFSRTSSYENSIDVWNGWVRGDHEGICEQEFSLTHDSKVFWKWYVVIYVLCYEFIKSRSATLALGVCYCYRQNMRTLYL